MSGREPTAADVHALFERVLDLDDAARVKVLDEACRDRPALRARVDALLASDRADATPLDTDATQLLSVLLDEEDVADNVGPYRIVRELGRGGMGAVYMAERADGEFEKQVALKLVKRGMDTDEILARFRHERRILASLEHENIARLYDGGASEDGRPYLVMELVDGEPITTYADRLRLPIDERLALFGTICAAVQHAHQKLVVHRDLKPSNILVTAGGTPKLLDFGIAKLLADDDDTAPRTRTGVRILTPEYAAPEQIRGEPVTTASDVYALGAVLYELLTGLRPFARAAQDARAVDPDRIADRPSSAVSRSVPGVAPDDALRPTAHAVADARSTTPDRLRRRLEGDLDTVVLRALDPDPAHRYGSAQQLLDDLERHRAGLPVLARAPTLAYRARKFMRRHRPALAAAALILLTLLTGMGATLWQARRAAAERDAAERARASSEQVAAFLLNMFDSADPLGVRMERTDTLRVREIVDRGAGRVREELAGQPRLQAEMLTMLGRVYAGLGVFDSAEELLEDALSLDLGPDQSPRARVVPLTLLAGTATQQGDFARADSLLATAIALYDETGHAPDSLYVASVSERGVALMYLGDGVAAQDAHERALALVSSIGHGGRPLHARVLNNLGLLHYNNAEYARAEALFRETLALERAYLPDGHARLATTLNNLASSLHYDGRLAESEPLYLEAVAISRAALGAEHSETGAHLQNLAILYDDQRRYAEAEVVYRQALRAHEASLGRGSVNTALLLRNFALNRYEAGEVAEAETLLREALATMSEQLGAKNLYTAVTAAALGRILTATGRLDEAFGHITRAIAALEEQVPADHHLVVVSRRDLGAYYTARGDYETAEPLLLASYETLSADRGPDNYMTRAARKHLHELYTAWGRPDRAREFAGQ